MVEFVKLRELLASESQGELNKRIANLNTAEGLASSLSWEGKKYKGTPEQVKAKLLKKITRENAKRLDEQLRKVSLVEKSEEFSSPLVVSVEWKASRMWGNNPIASTNFGFVGSSVGGCGYDKQSTALAEGLNSHLPLLRKLYAVKEGFLVRGASAMKDNHSILGYGSGYGVLPSFEGGVGVSEHGRIIEGVGLKFEHTSGKSFDVFRISWE